MRLFRLIIAFMSLCCTVLAAPGRAATVRSGSRSQPSATRFRAAGPLSRTAHPTPSVDIDVAVVGYHEIIPPYGDIVDDIISLDGSLSVVTEKIGFYTRSKVLERWSEEPLLDLLHRRIFFDKEKHIREILGEYSVTLEVAKDSISSIIARKVGEGGTIASIAALIAAVPEIGAATTLAGAVSLLEDVSKDKRRRRPRTEREL